VFPHHVSVIFSGQGIFVELAVAISKSQKTGCGIGGSPRQSKPQTSGCCNGCLESLPSRKLIALTQGMGLALAFNFHSQ
jgi:hypothetical protein